MPKMKTKSSAKKRFRITASGMVKRGTAYRSHILTSKTTKRKRKVWKRVQGELQQLKATTGVTQTEIHLPSSGSTGSPQ